MSWRDRLGRWARQPSRAEPEQPPEDAVARHAEAIVAALPPAVAARLEAELRPAPEPVATPEPTRPFADLLRAAQELAQRIERIESAGDRELSALRREGWTQEGIAALF